MIKNYKESYRKKNEDEYESVFTTDNEPNTMMIEDALTKASRARSQKEKERVKK